MVYGKSRERLSVLRPTPPKLPNNEPMTFRDWLPIILIVVIILYCAFEG